MYRFIFSMIVALALAAVMSVLFASPASAQCRAGACRAQFGRVHARRSYVYQTKPLTISEQYDLDYERRVVPMQAQPAPPPAVPRATGWVTGGKGTMVPASQYTVNPFTVMPANTVLGRIQGRQLVIENRALAGRIDIAGGVLGSVADGQEVKVTLEPIQAGSLGHHAEHDSPQAQAPQFAGERGHVGGRVLRGGGKVVRRIGKGLGKVLPPWR